MWPKFLNSKWFERLFTATLSIMLLLVTQRFTTVRQNEIELTKEKARIEQEINDRARIVYVDLKNKELKEELKKTDDDLRVYIDRSIISFTEDMREVRNYIIYKRIGSCIPQLKDTLIKEYVDPIKPIEYTQIENYALNNIDLNLNIN